MDSAYRSQDMTFFESHDLCDYREGATVAPITDNVYENCNFKMSYRIVKNFDGKKLWRTWRIRFDSPKFFTAIFFFFSVIT